MDSRSETIKERVESWLRQFDTYAHIDSAILLLSRFKMIGRVDTVAAMRSFIETNPEFRGATAVPFGSARDSGSIQTYFSADLIGNYLLAGKVPAS